MRVVELLAYTLCPGTGPNFHELMVNVSVPLQRSFGIDVAWCGPSLFDADSYLLIRSFADSPSMKSQLKAFYADTAWLDGPRSAVLDRIASSTQVVIQMTEAAIASITASPCSSSFASSNGT